MSTQPEGSDPAAWWQPLRGVRQGLAALRALRPQVGIYFPVGPGSHSLRMAGQS